MTQVAQAPSAVGPAAAAAPLESKLPEFTCTACAESYVSSADHRAHFKSERHVYNTKRKQAGLKPISQEAWERKLRESRGGYEQKGTAHLKAKKPTTTVSGDGSQQEPPSEASEAPPAPEPEAPLTPRNCLFDRKHFESVELCMAYMERTYSFFIPDQEYCLDVPAFLSHLGEKVSVGHMCIHCNKRCPDLASVRRHMIDKGHTQLASEAHTRRGNYDEANTDEMQAEMEPFFDFNNSVREVADKIQNPKQKVASILRFFDQDKDKILNPNEVTQLWAACMDGAELSKAQYEGACAMCKAEPQEGLDVEALGKLYSGGFADLDSHFSRLQELLVQKHKKPLKPVKEEDEDEDAEGEEAEDGDEEDESEDELEFDDEDEFEEVMRVLGLQKVEITASGDLKLPNGSVAAHRDVSFIYNQRGVRQQVALTGAKARRAQLMLSNVGEGCSKMAMTQRQEAREGKRIVAYLQRKQGEAMRLGLQTNHCQKEKMAKIRTGRGDCSNGR